MGRDWQKVIDFSNMGLNSDLDGADIADNECQVAKEVIFDNKCMEKAPGRTAIGTSSGYQIDGLHRARNKAGDKVLLRVSNGVLARWTGSTWSTVQSGLTAGKKCDFINADDKTIIANGYDEALEFDPSSNSITKLGLNPPRYYKKVAYFESDEESIWALATGAAFDNTIYSIEERTGDTKQSLYMISPAATTRSSTLTYASAQDFSNFQSGVGAISISDDAFFCASILHRIRAYVDEITFDFITSTGNYYRLTVDGSELDPVVGRDNVWTNVLAKKARFVATGTPDWSNITKFMVSLKGQTSNAEIFVDNCYWKNPPMEAMSYRVMIDSFEGLVSAWTINNGGSLSSDPINFVEGTKSLYVTAPTGTTILHKTISLLNLIQFSGGLAAQTSDEICISILTASGDNSELTSVTLNLYSDVAKYFSYAISTFNYGSWNSFRIKRSSFTDHGTADWSAIIKIELLIVSTASVTLRFDAWKLEQGTLTRQLADMETDEAWVIAGAYQGGFSDGVIGTSIYVTPTADVGNYLTLTLASPVDLTKYDGGEVSGEADYISFWIYYNFLQTLQWVTLQIDCNLGDFTTDVFTHDLSHADLQSILGGGTVSSGWINIPKSDFARTGNTPGKGWNTVKAYRFVIVSSPWPVGGYFSLPWWSGGLQVYLDDLKMVRRNGISGIYQWACMFCRADGTKSGISEWSEQVLFTGTKALITLIPKSVDSDISEKRFYRKGGNLGDTARLDFVIYDNTTELYATDLNDQFLGEKLDLTEIPNGTIRAPLGAKWGPQYKGEYILYRDPSRLNSAYWTLSDKRYGWAETQRYDFKDELLDVFLIDDILFFNTKSGVKSLSIPLSQATPDKFHETGIVKHSTGPNASFPIESEFAVVSYDGVYIFNGNSFRYISEAVKNYFSELSYDISEVIVFYRKRHLYISVISTGGTRTLLDCYLPTMSWRISDYIVNCFCVADGIGDNDEIYIGDLSGNVYQFDTGYASSFEFISKDYSADPANKFSEVILQEIFVMARSLSSTAGVINIQFRANQQLNAGIIKSFPSSGNLGSTYKLYHHQLQGVNNYVKGNKIGVAITPGTLGKHFAIQSILLKGEITPLPETYEEDAAVGTDLIIFLGRLSSDPSTSDWGTADAGKYIWFNTTDTHWKGWSGTEIVILG